MTSSKRLEDILKKEKANQEGTKVDWEIKRKAWLAQVDALYGMIEGWLKSSTDSQVITVTKEPHFITEQFVGKYQAQKLVLNVGAKKINLVPCGMLIIAARGRVDIEGPKGGKVQLLLLGEKEVPEVRVSVHIAGQPGGTAAEKPPQQEPGKLIWKVRSQERGLNVFPLTEEIFTDIIDQLL